MNSRHIIAEAWYFTRDNKKLMWWYSFFPSLLTTLIGILYLIYQYFSFKRSLLFENAEQSFLFEIASKMWKFLTSYDLMIPALGITIVIFILYALLPTLLQGGLIQIIAKKRKGESLKVSDGIPFGMLVFLPLLEYHLLIKVFSLFYLFSYAAIILRNAGPEALQAILPVFLIAAAIGLILTLLFTYSEFFIVLDKKPVFASMGRSAKLVILSWQHTFLISILMLIIGLRIIINIIAILLVPALLFFSAGLLATITLTKIGIAIGILISFGGLLVASYFSGILNLFANTVWTFTFMELMEEKRTQEFMSS